MALSSLGEISGLSQRDGLLEAVRRPEEWPQSALPSQRKGDIVLGFSLCVLSGVPGEADPTVVRPEPSWGPGREHPLGFPL